MQAVQYLVVLWILASNLNLTAVCLLAIRIEYEYPVAACALEEGALRDDDALGRLAQFQVDVVGLAGADVVRPLAREDKIRTELPFAYFRIYLAYLQGELLPLAVERSRQTWFHAVDVMLVYHRFDLVVGEVVHLPNHLPGGDVLP